MIEFLLIFVLGFAAALLAVAIVSPLVRNRIVLLTERRVRATAPLSAAELRAEIDAARARFAMENRRLAALVTGERRRVGALRIENERLGSDLAASRGATLDLEDRLARAAAEGGDLLASLQERDEHLAARDAELAALERARDEGARTLADAGETMDRLTLELENARIDLATRDANVEALRSQVEMLRDERNRLREETRTATSQARDLAVRLEREEERSRSLDARLSESVALLSDREGLLERRERELERLRRPIGAQHSAHADAVPENSLDPEPAAAAGEDAHRPSGETIMADSAADDAAARPKSRRSDAIARRIEALRTRHAALVETLNDPAASGADATVREEIGEIAAMMIELAAAREGSASPIHDLLRPGPAAPASAAGPSLAERALLRLKATERSGRGAGPDA